MYGETLVELALKILSCSQKELASRLKVSPTQISKWKKGEHMSFDMEKNIRNLAGIGEGDPEFIMLVGSTESAEKWEEAIRYLADMACENDETGFNNSLLTDEESFLCSQTFNTLKDMGVAIPKEFPKDFEIALKNKSEVGSEDLLWESIEANPCISLIYEIFNASNGVYGFYAAYVSDLIDEDDLDIYDSPAQNIEPCLLSLAACKVEVDEKVAPRYKEFKRQTLTDYEEWLTHLKIRAFRAGMPLKAELLKMVHCSSDELSHEAEAECLGFNSSNLHPDIYMNELLVGMRTIHQVLPAIMKKLGIDKEFKLDASDFYIK